eukprot:CAMPEP_0184491356 /NCGR_PEP_ID=MMETSP0113_2-20130426/20227_1 /TAXON_ID=91329 /ORGANISM="Norrisiella sphaerica, Strain BC52" /LENGTH=277 /DNA_ID=CAMNT_0026875693 /DNA_START=155 /DNA_END=988 /DNA_ORIENTATION=-
MTKFSVGVGSGFIQGMTGVGGGIVLTTAMTRMFSMTQVQATGTSLAVKITGNISAAATFAQGGLVDYASAFWIAMPAFIGVTHGARIGTRAGDRRMKLIFGGFLLALSPFCAFGKSKKDLKKEKKSSVDDGSLTIGKIVAVIKEDTLAEPARILRHMLVGLGFGYCTGMLGVGGAPLVMTYLFMDMAGQKEQAVIGTTLCAITMPSIVGMGVHWSLGNIIWPMVPVLCAGSLAGGIAGAQASMNINGEWMRYGFAGFLAVLGSNTLWKARAAARLMR